ncbi:hypothetical protein SDC9_187161 [bioreactor metagenome]|uniref:Uncharacterized protein n=1 Tax=bioreactor metagenome TaxID=1076179 RepID=A0A645HWB4_9ZZZZ
MVDQCVIGNRNNSALTESIHRVFKNVAPVQSLVHMANFSGIIAVSVVVAAGDHGAFHVGKPNHFHIFFRRIFAHKLRIYIGNVVIQQNSGVATGHPSHKKSPSLFWTIRETGRG